MADIMSMRQARLERDAENISECLTKLRGYALAYPDGNLPERLQLVLRKALSGAKKHLSRTVIASAQLSCTDAELELYHATACRVLMDCNEILRLADGGRQATDAAGSAR